MSWTQAQKRYAQSSKGKLARKKYQTSEKGRARHKEYLARRRVKLAEAKKIIETKPVENKVEGVKIKKSQEVKKV